MNYLLVIIMCGTLSGCLSTIHKCTHTEIGEGGTFTVQGEAGEMGPNGMITITGPAKRSTTLPNGCQVE